MIAFRFENGSEIVKKKEVVLVSLSVSLPQLFTDTFREVPSMSWKHARNQMLCHFPKINSFVFSSFQQTMQTLQNQMVGFLDRLHEAEVERRALRKDNARFKQEAGELRLSSGIVADLQGEINKLQGKVGFIKIIISLPCPKVCSRFKANV